MNRKKYSVRKMCRALGIPQCSYYQWLGQQEKRAEKKAREEALVKKVRDTFEDNERVYGCPKMQAALNDKGVEVKEWKLRRIMRENGLYPVTLKKWKPYRKGKCDAMYSENLVQRQFNPDSLNSVWVGDITYIRTVLGWVYLAVVLDLCNKEVVGYAVSRYIELFYNRKRLHSSLGYMTPVEYRLSKQAA